MADKQLTQKVLSTANLLLEAVKELESDSGGRVPQSGPSTSMSPSTFRSGPSTSMSPSTFRSGPSTCRSEPSRSGPSRSEPVHSELSKMFSWTSGKKGKRPLKEYHGVSKKKKMKTWVHTYVCLASTRQKYIPTASKRTTLKLAGLGEKKFAVFAYCSSPELQEELFREYPKLADAGGFELLRASDVGVKELVLIDIPNDGYSVEYLQAVVKGAKIYIRPLQKDLDETALEDRVRILQYSILCV